MFNFYNFRSAYALEQVTTTMDTYHIVVAAVAEPVPRMWLAVGRLPLGAAAGAGAEAAGAAVASTWSAVEGEAAPSSHRTAGGTAEGTVAGHTQAIHRHHHLAVDHHSHILVADHHSPYHSHHHW